MSKWWIRTDKNTHLITFDSLIPTRADIKEIERVNNSTVKEYKPFDILDVKIYSPNA